MTDPDLLFTAKIRNLTENELVVFFVCSVFYQIIFRAKLIFSVYCGETGIRTPGTSQYNGFQDRRNRPLCHLSKTPFQKYFPLKALQRYNFILNKQIVYQFFCYKIFKSYFCIRIINERNKS